MIKGSMRERVQGRKAERFRPVRVETKNNFLGKAEFITACLLLAAQVLFVLALYIFLCVFAPVFFYISLGLTALTGVFIFITDTDGQCKASWLMLMLVSGGCGFLIYILAHKSVCYGGNKSKFDKLYKKSVKFTPPSVRVSDAIKADCDYLFNAGGFSAYSGTNVKYFDYAKPLFDEMFSRIESAKSFIFIEFFILADGYLLERLLKILKRKLDEGVEVRVLYDGAGSYAPLKPSTKKRMHAMGIELVAFAPLLSPFGFGLNFRDHRKIVVIDGKTGFVCGCNIADECVNLKRAKGVWKDAGLRLDGSAVDGLTLAFLRQWDFTLKCDGEWDGYLNRFEKIENNSTVVPFAGGPDLTEPICRTAYANMIRGARQRLYIMTPYFNPDGEMLKLIKERALSGVDVRLVLPSIPDWQFLYKVTQANAEKLIASGVKVYFTPRTFLHSKVILSENCCITGSVNIDMRTFYQEFDNAVLTDDNGVMREIEGDFNSVFAVTSPAQQKRRGLINALITSVLKIFSPLM